MIFLLFAGSFVILELILRSEAKARPSLPRFVPPAPRSHVAHPTVLAEQPLSVAGPVTAESTISGSLISLAGALEQTGRGPGLVVAPAGEIASAQTSADDALVPLEIAKLP